MYKRWNDFLDKLAKFLDFTLYETCLKIPY